MVYIYTLQKRCNYILVSTKIMLMRGLINTEGGASLTMTKLNGAHFNNICERSQDILLKYKTAY
jgi:hypothetical protein